MSEENFLSVSELSTLVDATLVKYLSPVSFEGELSEVKSSSAGHFYLTIKDSSAQLGIIIWRGKASGITFKLEPGKRVRCRGKPNFYDKRGELRFIVDWIAESGEGELQKRFLELKAKLEGEGLSASGRKRALPFMPKGIGIITSKTGAAIKDIEVKLVERMPNVPRYLIDVRVQGPGSAQEIARAIEWANKKGDIFDVLIVGRGGGSLEDLWAFNEEIVVRAVFASKIPVISAVGHEVDISLSDLAADRRAPTPTAAAEMVVPRRDQLMAAISELERRITDTDRWITPRRRDLDEAEFRLQRVVKENYERRCLALEKLSGRLGFFEPTRLVSNFSERISSLGSRFEKSISSQLGSRKEKLLFFERMLSTERISQQKSAYSRSLDQFAVRLRRTTLNGVKMQNERLKVLERQLNAVSPQNILERGFSYVQLGDKVITDSGQLKPGEEIRVKFAKGAVLSTVKSIESGKQKDKQLSLLEE